MPGSRLASLRGLTPGRVWGRTARREGNVLTLRRVRFDNLEFARLPRLRQRGQDGGRLESNLPGEAATRRARIDL